MKAIFIKAFTNKFTRKDGSVSYEKRALYQVVGTPEEIETYVSHQEKPAFINDDKDKPAYYSNKRTLTAEPELVYNEATEKYNLVDTIGDNITLKLQALDPATRKDVANAIAAQLLAE